MFVQNESCVEVYGEGRYELRRRGGRSVSGRLKNTPEDVTCLNISKELDCAWANKGVLLFLFSVKTKKRTSNEQAAVVSIQRVT